MASSSSSYNSMSVDFSFPDYFLQPARCLIVLTGLDTRNNAVHMAIWDLFKVPRRGERKPVNYTRVNADHLYPKRKEVISDDVNSPPPSGILKLNWMNKHTNELPAVVVFFFDLDWTHPQWDAKVIECASKINVIRSSLNGHNTEICVALIQSVKPNVTGSDATVSEKAAQLCAACDLPSPNLFVMPYVDRPEGYVNRLEATFYELALSYYNSQSRKIRIARDGNKMLTIRRMFKLAFFTEMKQDNKEALKHYVTAYKYITDFMVLNENRIMEIKMIAGFLNFKVCKHMFELDDARNAIAQNQKFLELFRKEKGPSGLLFQHLEWISNQYTVFADLFSEAVSKGLKPSQIQHPGIHYYQAALHELERRKLKESLCKEAYCSLPHPLPHPFTDIPVTEYIGERPWRVGLNDSQPSGSALRTKTITMFQAHEYTVNTSEKVKVLLSKALHYFKELECNSEHMINHLKVLLSDEYFIVHDYEKCLALLKVAVIDYRSRRWWKILSHVLYSMMRCAFEQGLITTYVSVCLELISRFIPTLVKDKNRIQDNLHCVLKGEIPNPEPGTDQSLIESMTQSWKQGYHLLQNENKEETSNIIMSDLASCVECKTWFTENSYTSDCLLQLEVYFRSNAPLPISFSSVRVTFDHQVCNKWCIFNEPLVLEPGKYKQIVFEFPTTSETLQVLTVEASLEPFKLVWRGGVSGYGFPSQDWLWNKLATRTSTLILQREPQISLSVDHKPPILLTEVYPVTICVTNNEEKDITNIILLAVLLQDHEQNSQTLSKEGTPLIHIYSTYPTPTQFPLSPNPSTPLESRYCHEASSSLLPPGEKFVSTFYIKSYSVGAHKLSINCTYNIDCLIREDFDPIQCKCDKEETVTMETITPLRVSHRILNMQFQPQDCVFFDEPFLLQSNIVSHAPWNISITSTQYQLKEDVSINTYLSNQMDNLVLSEKDVGSELHLLMVSSQSMLPDNQLALGTFKMKWKRKGELTDDGHSAIVTVNLPSVILKTLPYSVSIDIPAFGILNQMFTITYKVKNKTMYVQSFDSVLPSSTDFVLSGNRITPFQILPNSTHSLSFNLFPLNVGYVILPKIEVTCTTQPKLDEKVLRGATIELPNSIFVVPSPIGTIPDSS